MEYFHGTPEEIIRYKELEYALTKSHEAPKVILPKIQPPKAKPQRSRSNKPKTKFGLYCEGKRAELGLTVKAITEAWGYPKWSATWSQWMNGTLYATDNDLEFLQAVLELPLTVTELRELWNE